jgi:DNA polymerase-3 subunit gamma/tau
VLGDLAEFTHFVTRVKIVPAVAEDVSLAEVERSRGRTFAEKLSMRVLARAWQMLLKGIAEVEAAGRPIAAAEMLLVRMAYAADLPTPDEVVRSFDKESRGADSPAAAGASAAARASGPGTTVAGAATPLPRSAGGESARPAPTAIFPAAGSPVREETPYARPAAPAGQNPEGGERPPLAISRFEDLIALAASKRDIGAKLALERDVRLVRCEDGQLEIALEPSAAKTLVNDLARKLSQWTNRRWMVIVSAEEGAPTVKAQNEAREAELKSNAKADPLVAAVLARFPGAEIVAVREPQPLSADYPETGSADAPLTDDEFSESEGWQGDEQEEAS